MGYVEIVKLEKADDDTLFKMIQESIKTYQEHHKIQIDDETILILIRLSKSYLKEKSLPESDINLIEHTIGLKRSSNFYLIS